MPVLWKKMLQDKKNVGKTCGENTPEEDFARAFIDLLACETKLGDYLSAGITPRPLNNGKF